jgi:hypothetical protein
MFRPFIRMYSSWGEQKAQQVAERFPGGANYASVLKSTAIALVVVGVVMIRFGILGDFFFAALGLVVVLCAGLTAAVANEYSRAVPTGSGGTPAITSFGTLGTETSVADHAAWSSESTSGSHSGHLVDTSLTRQATRDLVRRIAISDLHLAVHELSPDRLEIGDLAGRLVVVIGGTLLRTSVEIRNGNPRTPHGQFEALSHRLLTRIQEEQIRPARRDPVAGAAGTGPATQTDHLFCESCGQPVALDAAFCGGCGARQGRD